MDRGGLDGRTNMGDGTFGRRDLLRAGAAAGVVGAAGCSVFDGDDDDPPTLQRGWFRVAGIEDGDPVVRFMLQFDDAGESFPGDRDGDDLLEAPGEVTLDGEPVGWHEPSAVDRSTVPSASDLKRQLEENGAANAVREGFEENYDQIVDQASKIGDHEDVTGGLDPRIDGDTVVKGRIEGAVGGAVAPGVRLSLPAIHPGDGYEVADDPDIELKLPDGAVYKFPQTDPDLANPDLAGRFEETLVGLPDAAGPTRDGDELVPELRHRTIPGLSVLQTAAARQTSVLYGLYVHFQQIDGLSEEVKALVEEEIVTALKSIVMPPKVKELGGMWAPLGIGIAFGAALAFGGGLVATAAGVEALLILGEAVGFGATLEDAALAFEDGLGSVNFKGNLLEGQHQTDLKYDPKAPEGSTQNPEGINTRNAEEPTPLSVGTLAWAKSARLVPALASADDPSTVAETYRDLLVVQRERGLKKNEGGLKKIITRNNDYTTDDGRKILEDLPAVVGRKILEALDGLFTGFVRMTHAEKRIVGRIPKLLGGVVEGRVVDEEGDAIVGATVRVPLADGDVTTTTGPDGRFGLTLAGRETPSKVTLLVEKDGYVAASRDVPTDEHTTLGVTLEAGSSDVISITSELHHLGDGNFGGSRNSKFQEPVEGASFETSFDLSETQADPDGARLRYSMRGTEADNTLAVNGTTVGKTPASPKDGSATTAEHDVDPATLRSGPNTFEATSVQTRENDDDLDDFEMWNVRLHLLGPG
jgi:hypothetical protein